MKVLEVIGVILLMSGVILVYDARKITKKAFGYGDQNQATKGLKMMGFILSVVGGIMLIL